MGVASRRRGSPLVAEGGVLLQMVCLPAVGGRGQRSWHGFGGRSRWKRLISVVGGGWGGGVATPTLMRGWRRGGIGPCQRGQGGVLTIIMAMARWCAGRQGTSCAIIYEQESKSFNSQELQDVANETVSNQPFGIPVFDFGTFPCFSI